MHILYRAMLSGVRYTQAKCVFKTNYIFKKYTCVRYTFSSNHNDHKSLCGFCFWASDPLININSIN